MRSYNDANTIEVTNINKQSINNTEKNSLLKKLKLKMPKTLSSKRAKTLLSVFVLVVCALLILKALPSTSSESVVSATQDSVSYTSSLEYISILEEKLNKVLSGINGAGKTQVMISIESSPILTIAKNEESKTVSTAGGSTTTTTFEPIYYTSNGKTSPLIIGETLPQIKGVVVVSSGASDVRVKMDIINAVSTALGISSNIIDVFVGG